MLANIYSWFVRVFWFTFVLILGGSLYVHVIYFSEAELNDDYFRQGKELYLTSKCADCHGAYGEESMAADFPRINDQPQAYILRQMRDIKSSARNNGGSAQMRPFLKDLDDEQISLIAYYLAHN